MSEIDGIRNGLTCKAELLDKRNNAGEIPYISTGIKSLDTVLDGGLYTGLYTLGGMSSTGKSTLMLQIADNIASTGRDILFFSLEMSATELIAKIISKTTFQICVTEKIDFNSNAKTMHDVMLMDRYNACNQKQREILDKSFAFFDTYGQHLFIHDKRNISVSDIRRKIDDFVNLKSIKPVVFIDYLQKLKNSYNGLSDKQAVDRVIASSADISREFDIPIVVVSSFNRSSYNTRATLASFKETGGVEYESDVVLALQFQNADCVDIENEKLKSPREMEIAVLKNRNAMTGNVVPLGYYAEYNIFAESFGSNGYGVSKCNWASNILGG